MPVRRVVGIIRAALVEVEPDGPLAALVELDGPDLVDTAHPARRSSGTSSARCVTQSLWTTSASTEAPVSGGSSESEAPPSAPGTLLRGHREVDVAVLADRASRSTRRRTCSRRRRRCCRSWSRRSRSLRSWPRGPPPPRHRRCRPRRHHPPPSCLPMRRPRWARRHTGTADARAGRLDHAVTPLRCSGRCPRRTPPHRETRRSPRAPPASVTWYWQMTPAGAIVGVAKSRHRWSYCCCCCCTRPRARAAPRPRASPRASETPSARAQSYRIEAISILLGVSQPSVCRAEPIGVSASSLPCRALRRTRRASHQYVWVTSGSGEEGASWARAKT